MIAPARLDRVRRFRWPLAGVGLAAGFLASAEELVRGRLAPFGDADGFFAPYYTLVADFARAGRLLLWNPWTNGGSPDYIEPQVGGTSPLITASAALTGGGELGYRIHWLAIWLVGGLGVLVLGRRLRVPATIAAAVALAFLFSGPFIGNAQHLSWLYTFSLLPWALWRLDVALDRGSWFAATQAGALWGLSALGGYPGVVVLTGGVLVSWAASRFVTAPAGSRQRRPRTVALIVGCCLFTGAIVMLPSVIPILVEGKGFTDRAAVLSRHEAVTSNPLHPRALSTLASPFLTTLPAQKLWPHTDLSSTNMYVGALSLTFAVYAIVARPRDGLRWCLLGTAALFCAFAVGPALPLRAWLYDLVPPTRYFRHATIFRLATVFCLTVLALLGGRDLLMRQPRRGAARWSPVMVAGVLAAGALATYVAILRIASGPGRGAADIHLAAVWLGVVAIAAAACWPRTRRRTIVLLLAIPLLSLYDAHATFSMATTVGMPAAAADWPRLEARRSRTLNLLDGDLARLPVSDDTTGYGPGPTDKNLLDRKAVVQGYAPLNNTLLARWMRVPVLADAVVSPNRVLFAGSAVEVPPTAAVFAAFEDAVSATNAVPLVVHRRASMSTLNKRDARGSSDAEKVHSAPPAHPIAVRWDRYGPDRLAFSVDAPRAGWLLITDRWARGWRATVDGRPTEVLGGDFLFRAVRIGSGRHTVAMSYRPFGHPVVVLLSWGLLLVVAVGSASAVARNRRAGRNGAPVTAGAAPRDDDALGG